MRTSSVTAAMALTAVVSLAAAQGAPAAKLVATSQPAAAAQPVVQGKPSLQKALADLKVPPPWFEKTTVHWDMNKPWEQARLEVRRLLAMEGEPVHEAIKITWLYSQKGDIGNGHELPMYLFMGGEYAWATVEYSKHFQKVKAETHSYLCYASCLAHFGEYAKAMEVLNKALADLPAPPWRVSAQANVQDMMGDLYADMGDIGKAKEHYAEAIRLYPTSDQPYGRHLLPRYVNKVQTKLDLLTMNTLDVSKLRDGTFTGRSLGYSDTKDMEVTLTISGGRISDVKVKHQEKIDLGATEIIPQQIVAANSLKVDAITGATVTSHAIVEGAYQALKQAGLK